MQLNIPPRKAIRFSDIQDIIRLLCNPGVRYRNHNSLSVVRILIQVSPVHTRQSLRSIEILCVHLRLRLTAAISGPQVSP
jgi:hypothetical protein